MNIINRSERIMSILLVFIMLFGILPTDAFTGGIENEISDGTYNISVKGWNEFKDTPSMMTPLLDEEGMLEVKDGNYTLSIKFIDGAIMGQSVSPDDIGEVWAEKDFPEGEGIEGTYNESKGNKTYTFPLSTLDLPLLTMKVIVMDNIQTIRLKIVVGEKVEEEPENGTYNINIEAWHGSKGEESMMAPLLSKKGTLKVRDGNYTLSIKFINGEIMRQPVLVEDGIGRVWVGNSNEGEGITGVYNKEEGSKAYTLTLDTLDLPLLSIEGRGTIRLNIEGFTGFNCLKIVDDIEPNKEWTIKFNDSLDKDSFDKSKIYVLDENNKNIGVEVAIDPSNAEKVIVKPTTSYNTGEIYRLYVEEDLKSKNDVGLKKGVMIQFIIKY